MNIIEVIPFGQITEITGDKSFQLEAVDTAQVQQLLAAKFPAMAQLQYAIAVNKVVVKSNVTLPNRAVVALLPPFSGG